MRKVLFVGDVHATPDDLDDCRALFELVRATAKLTGADEICLLGDSYHTFNIVRVEVLAFWRDAFKELRKLGIDINALVGNHDYAGEGSSIHAMLAHEDQVRVIAAPYMSYGVLYMPYYSDRVAFVADAAAHESKVIVCHQTFAGSKYENGFYSEDGVNPDELQQDQILSGHIHTPQTFGKVTYIGAPRWRTLSDANTNRAIWLYTFDGGRVVERKGFDTGQVCRQIRYVVDSPDEPLDGVLDPKHDWRIDVRGPAIYVEERKAKLSGPGVKLRTFKTEQTSPVVRESDGVPLAFKKYLDRYSPRYGTPPGVLSEIARERLGF